MGESRATGRTPSLGWRTALCIDRWMRLSSRDSRVNRYWMWFVCTVSLYSVVATPLLLCFPRLRYRGHGVVEGALDTIFILVFFVQLRTVQLDVSGQTLSLRVSARRYLRRDGAVDAFAALPMEAIATALCDVGGECSATARNVLRWLQLLRALRGRHVLVELAALQGGTAHDRAPDLSSPAPVVSCRAL